MMPGPKLGSMFRGSLRRRIKEYFDANPDEYLTNADASIKWGYTQSAVRQSVSQMRVRGELGPGPEIRLPK